MARKVVLLLRDGGYDSLLHGVFNTKKKAKKARAKLLSKGRLSLDKNDFTILKIPFNKLDPSRIPIGLL